MSEYNLYFVKKFIYEARDTLKNLYKFKNLPPITNPSDSTIYKYIDVMKLTSEQIDTLIELFGYITVPENELFITSRSLCRNEPSVINKIDFNKYKNSGNIETLFEEFDKNKYKGTMSTTSYWSPNKNDTLQISEIERSTRYALGQKWTSKNYGSFTNINTNSTFLGGYYGCFGRLLFYSNTKPLVFLNLGVDNLSGRQVFSYIITKMILGSDYDFSKNIHNNPSGLSGTPSEFGCEQCPEPCKIGVWSFDKTLIENIRNYFLEIAKYDNIGTRVIDGILLNDVSIDPRTKKFLSGTEFRIFTSEMDLHLESILFFDNFYYNIPEYKNAILKKINEYIQSNALSSPIIGSSDDLIEYLDKKIGDYYNITRNDKKISRNEFYSQRGGNDYKKKYLKYKMKYLKLNA